MIEPLREDGLSHQVVGPSKPRLLEVLGPGLITGASDDDPSGIATYSQAGAQFRYGLTWTLLFTYPLMVVIQEISARIGRASGRGIAGNLRRYYPNWLLQGIVVLLLLANTINIGADLAAMGEVLGLFLPGPRQAYILLFGLGCVAMQVLLKYSRYVRVLKWLSLSLFAYFGTLVTARVSWGDLARSFFIPPIAWQPDYFTTIVAVFGTTISPYLFFWQASQEAEDIRDIPARDPLVVAPEQAPQAVQRIRIDTCLGMAFSNLVALAIMVTAAATLNVAGTTHVETAAQAAEALRPIAGDLAYLLFALGVIGTGLLAIPVLAGSAAYAIGEARKWPVGLQRKPREAKAFYATVAVATLLGAAANVVGINPIKALFLTAVINGVAAVPVMVCMMLMSSRNEVMGPVVISRPLRVIGWLATAAMAASVLAMALV